MTESLVELLERRALLSFASTGTPISLPLQPTGDVKAMDVAVAADGSFVVGSAVSAGGSDSASQPVTMQVARFSADGAAIGEPAVIASFEAGDNAVSLDVDVDPAGDAVILYNVPPGGGASNPPGGDYVARVSTTGIAGAPFLVGLGAEPVISMDDTGGFVVAAFGGKGILVQGFDRDDKARGPQIETTLVQSELAGQFQEGLRIAAQHDGSGAVVAYVQHVQEIAEVSVLFSRYSTSAEIGSGGAGVDGDQAQIAMENDGSFDIAFRTPGSDYGSWIDLQESTDFHARVDHFSPTGEFVEGHDLDTTPGQGGYIVSLHNFAGGGFVTAFAQTMPITVKNIPYVRQTLYVQRFDGAGNPIDADPIQVDAQRAQFQYYGAGALSIGSTGAAVLSTHTSDGALAFQRIGEAELAFVDGPTLHILGAIGDDRIEVTQGVGTIIVARGSAQQTFGAATISSLLIEGFAGRDKIVNATALPASITGGDGNDTLVGGDANDSLSGNAGRDVLIGRRGADRLAGNGGRDRLYGGGGNDRIYGGASGDWLYSQGGSDQLFGGGGNDRLYVDYVNYSQDVTFFPTLHGGAGNDTLVSMNNSIDQLFGDAGHDTASADTNGSLGGAIDILTSIEASV